MAPRRPELQINTEPRRDAYEIDQPFQATCISRDGRPPARIQWFLDEEELTEGLSLPRVIESLTDRNTTLYTVVQTLTRHLKATDDRKVLYCRTSHPAEPGATQENKFQFQVRCKCWANLQLASSSILFIVSTSFIHLFLLFQSKQTNKISSPVQPQPLQEVRVYGLILGETAIVNVTIRANPRPRIEWTIDGVSIAQGNQAQRYEAYQPLDLGNGIYNVSLIIAGLTLEDTNKIYHLKASNEFGVQDYSVRISSSPLSAESGFDLGSIIGIVVGVALLVIIVVVILFARATGRLCFSGELFCWDNIQSITTAPTILLSRQFYLYMCTCKFKTKQNKKHIQSTILLMLGNHVTNSD